METDKQIPRYRAIYHGNKQLYEPVEVVVNGITMLKYPTRYRKEYINETGGKTIEFSLQPFEGATIEHGCMVSKTGQGINPAMFNRRNGKNNRKKKAKRKKR